MTAFLRIYCSNMRQICLIMTNLFNQIRKLNVLKLVVLPYLSFHFSFFNLEIFALSCIYATIFKKNI